MMLTGGVLPDIKERRTGVNMQGLDVWPARGQPLGSWNGPVRAGLSEDSVRLDGRSGRTALTQTGRRASAGQR